MITSRVAAASGVRERGQALALTVLVWTLIVLMIVPEGFDYSILIDTHAPTSGSAFSRLLWLALLVAAAGFVLRRAALAGWVVRELNPFLLAFVALALTSIAWSIEPVLTLRRDIRLLTMVLVCLAFVLGGWHRQRFQDVVRPVLTLMLLGSVLFGLVRPDLGIHQETSYELLGAWRGLTNHKNTLGTLACITLIFWAHGWLAREVHLWRALGGSALAVLCLCLSRSETSGIAAVLSVVMLTLVMRTPRSMQPVTKMIVIAAVTALIVYALAMLRLIPGLGVLLAPVTMLTDLDTSFTGRREIWWIIHEHMQLHPLLGTGYGAYWSGPSPQSPSYEFMLRMGSFYPGSAHNGYLEIANDLGWVGLLCLLGYVVNLVMQSLRLLTFDVAQAALFIALLLQQAITNLSESHWLSVLSVNFVITTLATTALARAFVDQRLRQRAARARTGHMNPATITAAST